MPRREGGAEEQVCTSQLFLLKAQFQCNSAPTADVTYVSAGHISVTVIIEVLSIVVKTFAANDLRHAKARAISYGFGI